MSETQFKTHTFKPYKNPNNNRIKMTETEKENQEGSPVTQTHQPSPMMSYHASSGSEMVNLVN